jgi:hypothetical protein
MNNELERVWMEVVVVYFMVISQHLPGSTEEHHKPLSQDSQSLGRDLNQRPPEYEAGMVITRSRRWTTVYIKYFLY